jgi:hypothetical protein
MSGSGVFARYIPKVFSDVRGLYIMGYGFGIGSALFGLGAVMAIAQANLLATNVVYALGAVCFTSAAAVQWRSAHDRRPPRPLHDPDWVSAAVQFVGTLSFNVMTVRAVLMSVHPDAVPYTKVWDPDVFGSALFLISSWIAWHPIAREKRHHLVRGRSLFILVANMLGSVFFALSAWGAALLPGGTYRSLFWNNAGTFLGAVFFLLAAVALLPRKGERTVAG